MSTRRSLPPLAACLLLAPLGVPPAAADPLAHTYSIVARDPETGNFGVAVQSHWFQVGPIVPWAEAGVGAVATQSFVRVDYGPLGLERMRAGKSAREALDALVADDPQRDVRQVAMVDREGRVAAWTGPKCIAAAGHQTGAGYSVQANLMDRPTVWPAMARAYEAAKGGFASRLLAALEAAEAEGGDIRGRQSAALVVVRAKSTGKPWEDRLVDLRVDDHPEPLAELRRLLDLHRAYDEMNHGDEAVAKEEFAAALGHYTRASELAPEIAELPFWQAVTLFVNGREAEALRIFAEVFGREERWARLVPRLPASGLLPDDPAAIARILRVAPGGEMGNPDPDPDPEPEPGDVLRIEGRLTDEGVECPALRDLQDKLYTLTGDLGGFGPGDEVWIEARPVEMSFCMQGTTVSVLRIGKR